MILALDIAFANMGWAVLDKGEIIAYGTIVTEPDKRKTVKASDDYVARCNVLSSGLRDILQHYTIKGIVGELPHGSQNAKSAKLLGGAAGIVAAVATCYDIPCEWISEGDSKKAALGKRSAAKEEAMAWARKAFPGYDFPTVKKRFEHVADALMAYNGMKNGILVRAFG